MTNQAKRPHTATPATWSNPFANLSAENLPAGASASSPVGAVCNRDQSAPKLGRVILRRENAHRGGKTVIVVHDFPPQITAAFINDLARKLKKTCGCGGTVKERTIEIQGDQPAKIRAALEATGFQVAGVR
jgi:translation initiation factor 1